MFYDKLVIRILLLVTKILARYGKESYGHEIEKIEKEVFDLKEED